MIVFHGTSKDAAQSILDTQAYVPLSTTTDKKIGELFALRRSSPEIMQGKYENVGRIIEFAIVGQDWKYHRDPDVLQDEKEIRIHKATSIVPVALWVYEDGFFVRKALDS